MLNIFMRHLVQNRTQRYLWKSTWPWSSKQENFIRRVGNFSAYVQFHQIHTFGPLNRYDDSDRIQKEYEHYADVSKSVDTANQMKLLAKQGRIDDAIVLYEKSKQQHANQLDDYVPLTLINILVKAKRFPAAKEFVVNLKVHELRSSSSPQTNRILCTIFDHFVHHLNLTDLNLFVEHLIFKRKYVSRTVLEIIINGLLSKKENFDTILNVFERMANQFQEAPLFQSIACELINNGDTERLERLLAISTKVHGRVNSLFSMAFALNACNRIEQARKIFDSLGNERTSERLEQCIDHLRIRRQVKLLENLLRATDGCVLPEYREQIYLSLLECYAYKNVDITQICSAMDQEKIVPSGQMLEKITQILKRNSIIVPNSWRSIMDGKKMANSDDSDVKLNSFLDANEMGKANELLLQLMQTEKALNRKTIRYCLLKNAEHANVDIFQHLSLKLDASTKVQLLFYRYECAAYLKAKMCAEYLQMIGQAVEQNKNDLKTVAINMPENLIDLLGESTDIYEQFTTLAKRFADKDIIKPICICWTYNFLNNKNTEENQLIWQKYLKNHGTILCKVATKVLMHRNEPEKLREFLHCDQVDRHRILKTELGKTYSILFDKLYYNADYNGIIDELKKMVPILSIKYLKSNTVKRLKFGPPELKEKFWNIINDAE